METENRNPPNPALRLAAPGAANALQSFAILLCLAFVLLVLVIIFRRISYPYELEGLEGEGFIQVYRLIHGLALYSPPSIQYVPFIYPPVFYYAAAFSAQLFGFGFGAVRLVSLLASAACMVVLYLALWDLHHRAAPAILALGCFAAAFIITGQWFDIARPDMLAGLLCLLPIYLARERNGGHKIVLDLISGALFALALLTKQQSLVVFAVIFAYYLVFNWRVALRLALGFSLAGLVVYGASWLNSAGWISYYLFTIPAAHKFDLTFGGVISALLSEFIPVIGLVLVALSPLFYRPLQVLRDNTLRYYYAGAAGMLASGTAGYLNKFAGRNVFVPSYLGLALLAGLALGWWINHASHKPTAFVSRFAPTTGWLILIVQFVFLGSAFFSTRMIPTDQDMAAGDRLVSAIRQYPGAVLALDDNYLLIYAGKEPLYSAMAMSEIAGDGSLYPQPQWAGLKTQIYDLMHAQQTSAILTDFYDRINKDIIECRKDKINYPDRLTFIPVAGANTRPNYFITCK